MFHKDCAFLLYVLYNILFNDSILYTITTGKFLLFLLRVIVSVYCWIDFILKYSTWRKFISKTDSIWKIALNNIHTSSSQIISVDGFYIPIILKYKYHIHTLNMGRFWQKS